MQFSSLGRIRIWQTKLFRTPACEKKRISEVYCVVFCIVTKIRCAASQRLDILRKSWRVFHDRALLGRCFRDFVLPVLEHCSAVWCSAADTHLKLLDRAVSGARFLTGGVFECDISHR